MQAQTKLESTFSEVDNCAITAIEQANTFHVTIFQSFCDGDLGGVMAALAEGGGISKDTMRSAEIG